MSFTLLGAVANAATIVQTQNYSFTPTGNQPLTFNEFDTPGGTRMLLSVTVTTSLTKSGGSLFVDNDSAVSAEGSISQTVAINLSATGASLYNSTLDGAIGQGVTSTTNYFVALTADDGDGAGYHASGPDWGGAAFAENTVTQTEWVDNINTYIGSGTTFTVKVSGIQYTDTSSISGMVGAFTAATETTSATWQRIMETPVGKPPSTSQKPVVRVSWYDCREFLKKLKFPAEGWKFELPSEVEWEYACRAGSRAAYARRPADVGWLDMNSGGFKHPAGTKAPNAWSVRDMHGNVAEWCRDAVGPGGTEYAIRGGSWDSDLNARADSPKPTVLFAVNKFQTSLSP